MDDTVPPSADEATSSSFLVQFVIACMVVTFFVAVLLAYLYIYAKLWSRREDASIFFWRRRVSYHGRTTSTATTTRQPGLEPSALPSLPVVFYNPKDFKDGLECAVCLSELSQGEKARILPKCNHGFHVDCIDMWFQSHSTCPLCRTPVISLLNPPSLNPISAHNNNNVAELQEVRSPLPQSDDHVSTNVLFRGDETQVRALAVPLEEGHDVNDTSSTASTSREDHNLVIEIPTTSELCQDCSCSPPPEERSPVMARLRSLKRLLSRGKRAPMAPSPHGPTSGDIEQA